MSVADATGQRPEAPSPAAAGRYDAFVSYSRVDGDATRRLPAELKTRATTVRLWDVASRAEIARCARADG